MKRRKLFTLTSVLLCAVSCFGAVDEKKLLGSWEMQAGAADQIITFSSDHTYAASLQGAGSTGEWRIEGNKLTTKITTNTANQNRVGQENIYAIVALGDEVLVMKGSKAEVYSYKRLDATSGEALSDNHESAPQPAPTASDDSSSSNIKMGQEFRQGDFSYKILKALAGQALTRSFQKPLRAAEGADFVVIYYTIRNDGKESLDRWVSGFKIQDAQGRQFATSSEVETEIEMQSHNRNDLFVKELHPGVARTLKAGFEIPKELIAQPLTLLVPENGIFSSGMAKVDLVISKVTKAGAAKQKKQ
jgi:hypothetical protein